MTPEQTEIQFAHPNILTIGHTKDGYDVIHECPVCGNIGTLDDFDCLGADPGCVFCNECGEELRT